MPSIDYDAMRANLQRREDPLQFKLGGKIFRTKPSPSLGSVFDLMDAPEPTPETEAQAAQACCKFIRNMLESDTDRRNFDAGLDDLPVDDYPVFVLIAVELVRQYTFRPTEPSASSSSGQPGT